MEGQPGLYFNMSPGQGTKWLEQWLMHQTVTVQFPVKEKVSLGEN